MNSGPFVLTYTGKRLHLDAPAIEEIDVADIAHSLSLLCRFNGQCSHFYSVAQHSVHVSELAECIGPKDRKREFAIAGLLHDAAEAYIGDIVSPVKGYCPQLAELEDRILKVICAKFGVSLPFPEEIRVADVAMLGSEAKALCNGNGGIWSETTGIANNIPIMPVSSRVAEELFIGRLAAVIEGKF